MKIDTRELRLGNCVYFKNTHDIGTVEILHGKHFDCRDKYGAFIPNGKYDPIPLTEDILLKCGAVKVVEKQYNLFGMRLHLHGSNFIEYVHEIEIKSFHHLQNAYFFTRGKELKINL